MYHPVTTEVDELANNISNTIDALLESSENYVVIYPNNDHGSEIIINELERLKDNYRFKIFPSVRFECFLTLLKNADLMIGNSSAGVREVPFYGKPSINIGSRQNMRSSAKSIFNIVEDKDEILKAIANAKKSDFEPEIEFGTGNSDELFISSLCSNELWNVAKQKVFVDSEKLKL